MSTEIVDVQGALDAHVPIFTRRLGQSSAPLQGERAEQGMQPDVSSIACKATEEGVPHRMIIGVG